MLEMFVELNTCAASVFLSFQQEMHWISSTYSRERPEDAKSTAANFAFKHERREEIRGNQQFTFALTIQC